MTNISRKIFLDCGGWKGTYAREITEIYPDALVYSFEPNPELFHYFDNIKNCTLIKKGIWICDGKKEIYLDKENGLGSSLYKDKTSGNLDKNNPLIIEVINFSDWIKDNIKENDNVYLKINVEGAEYDVLNEMIKQQTIKYINTLRVEWHNTKIPSIREKHEILTKKLNKYMVKKLRYDTYEYDMSLFNE